MNPHHSLLLLLPLVSAVTPECPAFDSTLTTLLGVPAWCFADPSVPRGLSPLPGRICENLAVDQLAWFSSTPDSAACSYLSPDCFSNISDTVLRTVDPQCAATMSPEALARLGRRLQLLPPPCFEALSAKNFHGVTDGCGALDHRTVRRMVRAHQADRGMSVCGAFSVGCLRSLYDLAYREFTAECVAMWTEDMVATITRSQVARIGWAVAGMTEEAVGGLGDACGGLNVTQIAMMSSALGAGCRRLSVECARALPDHAVLGFSAQCFSATTPQFVAALSEQKIGRVPVDVMSHIKPEQLAALGKKCGGLRPPQIATLTSPEVCSAVSIECLQSMSNATLGHWRPDCVGHWGDSVISSLDAPTLLGLSEDVFATFDFDKWASVLRSRCAGVVSGLPASKLRSLAGTQNVLRLAGLIFSGSLSTCRVVCHGTGRISLPTTWLQMTFSEDSLDCVMEEDIRSLDDSVVAGMRCGQVAKLSSQALGGCIARIDDSLVGCVTRDQVSNMDPSDFVLAERKWAFLTKSAASGITARQVSVGYARSWPCSVLSSLQEEARRTLVCDGRNNRAQQTIYSHCGTAARCPVTTLAVGLVTLSGVALLGLLLVGLAPLFRAAFRSRQLSRDILVLSTTAPDFLLREDRTQPCDTSM